MASSRRESSKKPDPKSNSKLLWIAAICSFLGLFTPFALEKYKSNQVPQRQISEEEIEVRLGLIHIIGRLQAATNDVIRAHQAPQESPQAVPDSMGRYHETCRELAKFCDENRSPFLVEYENSIDTLILAIDEITKSILSARANGDARYEAAKWLTMRRWLQANPGDELAKEVRAQLTSEPQRYATYTREYMGWGVFALMAR